MVIVSSNGFRNKDKISELVKTVKNKRVYICTNAIEKSSSKEKLFSLLKENIEDFTKTLEYGELTAENINKYVDFYDCIYMAEGSLQKISDMLSCNEIKEGLLKFIDSGKLFITEGTSGHIVTDNLEYLNFMIKAVDEENKIYKCLDYKSLNTLGITNEKYIFHINKLLRKFKGALKLAEKKYRISITEIADDDFVVV